MYSHPKGYLIYVTRIGGLLIQALFFIAGFVGFFQVSENISSLDLLLFTLFFLPIYGAFFMIGVFVAGLFPSIRVVKTGIRIIVSTYYKHEVRWEEIDDLVRINSGGILDDNIVLAMKRKASLFGRVRQLLFLKHGKIVGHEQPIIILSKSLANMDEILSRIYHETGIRVK